MLNNENQPPVGRGRGQSWPAVVGPTKGSAAARKAATQVLAVCNREPKSGLPEHAPAVKKEGLQPAEPEQSLPDDCLAVIALHLPVQEVIHLSCTSRDLNRRLAPPRLLAALRAPRFGDPEIRTTLRWVRAGANLHGSDQLYFMLKLVESGHDARPALRDEAISFIAGKDKTRMKQDLLAIYRQGLALREHASPWSGPWVTADLLQGSGILGNLSDEETARLLLGWAGAKGTLPPVAGPADLIEMINRLPEPDRRKIIKSLRAVRPRNLDHDMRYSCKLKGWR